MKVLFIGLAFCSCAYTWLGCLAQWFAGPEMSGPLPPQIIAFRALAAVCSLCCFGAIFRVLPAAIVSWIAALIYLGISWKLNATWVFHDDLVRFTLWTPFLLTTAAIPPKTAPWSAP